MSGASVPPRIYMNMHAGVSDADAHNTPRWVWLMLFGVGVLVVFGLGMFFLLNTAF